MDFLITAALVVFVVFVAAWRMKRRLAAIREAAGLMLEDGALLLDARSAMEFGGGHHPGAINLPPQAWTGDLSRFAPKDRPVVVYCASGARSRQLAARLAEEGFTVVLDAGSLRALEGLPAATGKG